ncbi:MAG: C1 family peptidase [Fibromonadales bacterium]|nr:C1 family peptidase [Fibromonadales bacterium]
MQNRKFMFIPLSLSLLLVSCGEHSFLDFLTESGILSSTGWLADKENLNNIPQDIAVASSMPGSLPSAVSLESKFPPVGNQASYGTCVAWATGYNMKTALNAIEKGWNSSDLSKAANQTSPKDLWFVIDKSKKSTNCNGTNFEPALDALISKGAASLSSVPYSNMGNCSGTSTGNANNKLANYRKIAYNYALQGGSGSNGVTLDNFKTYLAQGRPILIGAKLGDRFMRWNNSSSISTDTYNEPDMQHAYHAMVLVGYDDSKYAFRVRNSWGDSWGDRGSIWVDYDFFLKNFIFAAFVAQNPPIEVKDEVKEQQLLTGYDLLASFAEDFQDPETSSPRARAFTYEVYNSGKETILASQRWTVIYMYYNAFNANDFDIIFEDYYTNEYGKPGEYGEYAKSEALIGGIWNYMNVLPGKKAGEDVFGSDGFYIPYKMPEITGKYFLVIYADAHGAIDESNEDNNFYFIGAEGGKPLEFASGVMKNKPASLSKALSKDASGKIPRATAKSVQEIGGSPNAYTPEEIKTLVSQSKKSGVLAKKVDEYRSGNVPVKKQRKGNPL